MEDTPINLEFSTMNAEKFAYYIMEDILENLQFADNQAHIRLTEIIEHSIDPWCFFAWLIDTNNLREITTLRELVDYIDLSDLATSFEGCYRGEYSSESEFVETYMHDYGDFFDLPDYMERYFDYQKYWDQELRYDYTTYFDGSQYHFILNQ